MKTRILLATLLLALAGSAQAKLPPLTEEQKAQAEERKAKAAEAAAKDAAALAAAQDKVAARWKGQSAPPEPAVSAGKK